MTPIKVNIKEQKLKIKANTNPRVNRLNDEIDLWNELGIDSTNDTNVLTCAKIIVAINEVPLILRSQTVIIDNSEGYYIYDMGETNAAKQFNNSWENNG